MQSDFFSFCIGCIVSLVAKNQYKHKISLKTICSKAEILTELLLEWVNMLRILTEVRGFELTFHF